MVEPSGDEVSFTLAVEKQQRKHAAAVYSIFHVSRVYRF